MRRTEHDDMRGDRGPVTFINTDKVIIDGEQIMFLLSLNCALDRNNIHLRYKEIPNICLLTK